MWNTALLFSSNNKKQTFIVRKPGNNWADDVNYPGKTIILPEMNLFQLLITHKKFIQIERDSSLKLREKYNIVILGMWNLVGGKKDRRVIDHPNEIGKIK